MRAPICSRPAVPRLSHQPAVLLRTRTLCQITLLIHAHPQIYPYKLILLPPTTVRSSMRVFTGGSGFIGSTLSTYWTPSRGASSTLLLSPAPSFHHFSLTTSHATYNLRPGALHSHSSRTSHTLSLQHLPCLLASHSSSRLLHSLLRLLVSTRSEHAPHAPLTHHFYRLKPSNPFIPTSITPLPRNLPHKLPGEPRHLPGRPGQVARCAITTVRPMPRTHLSSSFFRSALPPGRFFRLREPLLHVRTPAHRTAYLLDIPGHCRLQRR